MVTVFTAITLAISSGVFPTSWITPSNFTDCENETEEINKNYGWYVSKRDLLGRDVEGFDEEIVKQYLINYCYAEKQDYSDEYNLYFLAVGKLKEVFEEYDLALQLECRFSNDKGKELIIVSNVLVSFVIFVLWSIIISISSIIALEFVA